MHTMNWKKSMNNTSKRKRQTSLIKQLKRRLLVVVGLLVFVLIFCFPVGIFNASNQRNLDEQQIALQQGQSDLLLSMLNQGTNLKRYITANDTTFLQSFTSGRQQYLLTLQHLKNQAQGSNFSETTTALAQVEERVNAWYSTYAQAQIKNMQSGKLAEARLASAGTVGSALFDKVRTAVARLQEAVAHDFGNRQSRLDWNSRVALIIALLLSTVAMIVLWHTFIRLIKALTAHLTVLKTVTNQLGSGDLTVRVQELRYDELNDLGQTFNTMAEDLASRSREVERKNSELRDRRDELTAANSALEEANRVRGEFLSTMSHELRTPLASIIGFSQMLLDDADEADWNQQQHNDLERILKNGQHLLGLINDVLDLTKIEAGRMVIKYSQIDVQELLTSVVEEIQSMALAQHLVLRAEVDEGMDFLESNPLKLRQILVNLVSNAIKFTEQGEVTVSARRVISPDQEGERVALAVKDSGIGIPADIQAHVFEAFYQADGTYTRKAGGTGLGLSIVSQLTTLLGGTIAVTSTPGQGSTFTVMLPLKAVHHSIEQGPPRLHPAQPLEAPAISPSAGDLPPAMRDEVVAVSAHQEAADGQNHLILAVDDNPDIIVLIKAALKDTPYTVVGLQDSLQAMELAQALHPCAIMLDVMMPDVNGWQILHQLKENPATAAIPVMMITVLTEPTTGYVLGADAYLIKPFKTTVLLNTLQHLLASQQGHSQAGEREAQRV
jgi:signal transduction histidine kinase/ActR/RegA family two-component response regulator